MPYKKPNRSRRGQGVSSTYKQTPQPCGMLNQRKQVNFVPRQNTVHTSETRFYCTNAALLQEMFRWRNSTDQSKNSLPVKKFLGGRFIATATYDTEQKHEKYREGTRYFIVIPKNSSFLKRYPESHEFFMVRSRTVVDEVTEIVKRDGYAFNIDIPEERIMSEKFGLMMMTIAQKVSNHSFFRNYSLELKQDMAAYAYEKIIKGLFNYSFRFTNAFAYLTQATFNSFKSILAKHYKQVNIKRAMTKRVMMQLECDVPGSSVRKCLNKQFEGNDFDDFSEY